MTVGRQLAFPFLQAEAFAPATFLSGPSNAAATAWLDDPCLWPGLRLAVFGPAGCGKTHLLHSALQRRGGLHIPGHAVGAGAALPPTGLLAIDDADCVPDEEALLHGLNTATELCQPILLAGRLPPAMWPFALPDLVSRLRAITTVAIGLPDDTLLRALFARLLADRQMAVAEDVQDWLLARLPRTGGALREAACRLDRLSLAAGRSVGKTLAARVVEEMAEEAP